MGSFRDEINFINRKINSPVSTSKDEIEQCKAECKPYIMTFCKNVKSQIKEQAQRKHIAYDHKRKFFGAYVEKNPHYTASLSFTFKFNKETVFSCQLIHIDDEDGGKDEWGFVTNSADIIIYIISEVTEQLAKDEIYPVEHTYNYEFSNTHIIDIPSESYIKSLETYFSDYTNVNPSTMRFYCEFAFFIE